MLAQLNESWLRNVQKCTQYTFNFNPTNTLSAFSWYLESCQKYRPNLHSTMHETIWAHLFHYFQILQIFKERAYVWCHRIYALLLVLVTDNLKHGLRDCCVTERKASNLCPLMSYNGLATSSGLQLIALQDNVTSAKRVFFFSRTKTLTPYTETNYCPMQVWCPTWHDI